MIAQHDPEPSTPKVPWFEELSERALGDLPGHPFRGNQWTDGFPADNVIRSSDISTPDQEELREDGERHWEDLDSRTLDSFQNYLGGSHGSYNANANTPGYTYADDVAAIQAAILDAPEPKRGVLTYRGLTGDFEEVLKRFPIGSTIEMDGFQSTSFDVESAARFLSSSGAVTGRMDLSRGTLLEIVATRGLHLKGSSEDEFLLPHGSRFKVVGVKEVTIVLRGRSYEYEPQTLKRRVLQLQQVDRDDYPSGRVAEVDEDDDDDDDDDRDLGPRLTAERERRRRGRG